MNSGKFGYLVPEFPGQTHIFFWREVTALRRLGLEPDLVSTRRPPRAVTSHTWSREAMASTVYLGAPGGPGLGRLPIELLRSAPRGWLRCAAMIARAPTLGRFGRARLAALALFGARLAAVARLRGWRHVHVHSCADAAQVALFANLLSGLPYSLTLHGPLDDYGPNQREKWRHARFAIVITRRLLAEVHQQLGDSLPAAVDVAPMGVDVDGFCRQTEYLPYPGDGPLRVFSCGRLNPCKGHQHLIEAVARLRAGGLDARLDIAGEDAAGGRGYRATLEEQIASLRLAGAVRLLGAVPEETVRRALESAHVFVLASLAEPLGVAIMEAMAMSVPVVVTGAGGVPELVDDGVDGLLVPPTAPEELAACLHRLAADPQAAVRLGAAGRRKVEDGFSSLSCARTLHGLVRASLARS